MLAECVRTWKHLPEASYGHNRDRPKSITEKIISIGLSLKKNIFKRSLLASKQIEDWTLIPFNEDVV